MQIAPGFYRSAAICSMLTSLTTLLIIFLPQFYAPLEGFDGRMARVHDPAYQLRAWVYLIHPFLVLTAGLAVALRIRSSAPLAAIIGVLGFAFWALTEAGQQTLTLFAFDKWRMAYAAADAATRAQIRTNTPLYDGLWDAMYFLILICFSIGNLALGLALVRLRRLSRLVGCFLLAAVALTLTLIAGELQWPTLPASVTPWIYPAIQPLGRFLIGLWLWRAADEHGALPGDSAASMRSGAA